MKYDEAITWSNEGYSLAGKKNYAEALAAYIKAISLAPEEPIFWKNKAKALEALGEHEAAKIAVCSIRIIRIAETNRSIPMHQLTGITKDFRSLNKDCITMPLLLPHSPRASSAFGFIFPEKASSGARDIALMYAVKCFCIVLLAGKSVPFITPCDGFIIVYIILNLDGIF